MIISLCGPCLWHFSLVYGEQCHEAVIILVSGSFLKQYKENGTIAKKLGSGVVSQLSLAIQRMIEQTMKEDDESTSTQLQAKLADYRVYVSLAKILW